MANRRVTELAEPLRHRDCVDLCFAEVDSQRPDTKFVRHLACHQAGARWIANGDLAMGTVEQQSFLSQSIHVRRNRNFVTVTTHRRPEVINCDEKNVGAVLSQQHLRKLARKENADEQEPNKSFHFEYSSRSRESDHRELRFSQ